MAANQVEASCISDTQNTSYNRVKIALIEPPKTKIVNTIDANHKINKAFTVFAKK
jgi:hypothetical protein